MITLAVKWVDLHWTCTDASGHLQTHSSSTRNVSTGQSMVSHGDLRCRFQGGSRGCWRMRVWGLAMGAGGGVVGIAHSVVARALVAGHCAGVVDDIERDRIDVDGFTIGLEVKLDA